MKNISNIMIKSINLIDNLNTCYYGLFFEETSNFSETISLFKEKSNEFKDSPEAQRALFFAFKSYKNKFLKKLCKSSINNEMTFSDVDKLVLELIFFCQSVKGDVLDLISSLRLGLQFGIKNDIDKGIKKCPNCGTLWTKYNGSGAILCGRRGNSKRDNLSADIKNYIIKLIDDKIIVEEEKCLNKLWNNDEFWFSVEKKITFTKRTELGFPTNPFLLKEEEKKQNEKLKKENKVEIQPIGCTNHFTWYVAEDVAQEVIDLLNNNLLNDFTDYYSDVFEIEQELKIKVAVDEIKKKLVNEINNGKKFQIF